MAQKISQMTEQTTASMTEAGTSDFLGGYTATGGNANRKFSLSGLANYFLNKFKMTLGGSSQTVKSAIDALNSNAVRSLQPVHTDFNNIPPNTVVQVSTNSAVHAPEGATTFFGIVETVGFSESGHYMTQKAYKISSGIIVGIYYRFYTGSAWEEWYKIPTRSEVDALNSKVTLTKNATGISGWSNNNSANLTVETATKIFVISIDADKSISGNIIDKS